MSREVIEECLEEMGTPRTAFISIDTIKLALREWQRQYKTLTNKAIPIFIENLYRHKCYYKEIDYTSDSIQREVAKRIEEFRNYEIREE